MWRLCRWCKVDFIMLKALFKVCLFLCSVLRWSESLHLKRCDSYRVLWFQICKWTHIKVSFLDSHTDDISSKNMTFFFCKLTFSFKSLKFFFFILLCKDLLPDLLFLSILFFLLHLILSAALYKHNRLHRDESFHPAEYCQKDARGCSKRGSSFTWAFVGFSPSCDRLAPTAPQNVPFLPVLMNQGKKMNGQISVNQILLRGKSVALLQSFLTLGLDLFAADLKIATHY